VAAYPLYCQLEPAGRPGKPERPKVDPGRPVGAARSPPRGHYDRFADMAHPRAPESAARRTPTRDKAASIMKTPRLFLTYP